MKKLYQYRRILCGCICLLCLGGCRMEPTAIREEVNLEYVNDEKKMMLIYPTLDIPQLDEQLQAISAELNEEFANGEADSEFNMSYRLNKSDIFVSLMVRVISDHEEEVLTYLTDETGKEMLAFEDVFDEQQLDELAILIDERMRQQDAQAGSTLAYKLAMRPQTENFQKFYIDQDTVIFYFDCFDDNKVHEVHIPLGELADYLKLEITQPVYLTYDELLYEPVKIIDPNKPMVALTFDDGPNKYTEQLLDALREYNASATFFVLGSMVEKFPTALQRMVLEGNEIGNHTMDHRQLTKLSEDEIIEEDEETQHVIESIVHITPTLVRPPYGSRNETVNRILDYDLILWDLDTRDWASKDPQKIIEVTLNNVRDKDIILMHDIYPTSVQAAIELIPLLQERGYQLVTVSELLQYR